MLRNCNGVSCFQQIFEKKKLRIYLWVLGIFNFLSVIAWLPVFVSAEPTRTILSIGRSESRFESHPGGKRIETLKNERNFDVFY